MLFIRHPHLFVHTADSRLEINEDVVRIDEDDFLFNFHIINNSSHIALNKISRQLLVN